MIALLQRAFLAFLVIASAASPGSVRARADHGESTVSAARERSELVAHHDLVRAPTVDARLPAPTPALRAPWTSIAMAPQRALAPTLVASHVRARRSFTRPRVRVWRPRDPDDF